MKSPSQRNEVNKQIEHNTSKEYKDPNIQSALNT